MFKGSWTDKNQMNTVARIRKFIARNPKYSMFQNSPRDNEYMVVKFHWLVWQLCSNMERDGKVQYEKFGQCAGLSNPSAWVCDSHGLVKRINMGNL